MYKLTPELKKRIQKALNAHFNVNLSLPKIKVYHDPNEFFNVYEGKKRKRSLKDIVELDSEVSFFYDDETKTVAFKGFRRVGAKTFKRVKTVPIYVGDVVHEIIHHYQTETNGYGQYDMFEEGCNEFSRYVIVGDIDVEGKAKYSVYFPYILRVWTLLSYVEKDPVARYELIKSYNVSKNKVKLHNSWLDTFIKKTSISMNRKQLMNCLEDYDTPLDSKLAKIFDKQDSDDLVNIMYALYDKYKVNLIQLMN